MDPETLEMFEAWKESQDPELFAELLARAFATEVPNQQLLEALIWNQSPASTAARGRDIEQNMTRMRGRRDASEARDQNAAADPFQTILDVVMSTLAGGPDPVGTAAPRSPSMANREASAARSNPFLNESLRRAPTARADATAVPMEGVSPASLSMILMEELVRDLNSARATQRRTGGGNNPGVDQAFNKVRLGEDLMRHGRLPTPVPPSFIQTMLEEEAADAQLQHQMGRLDALREMMMRGNLPYGSPQRDSLSTLWEGIMGNLDPDGSARRRHIETGSFR